LTAAARTPRPARRELGGELGPDDRCLAAARADEDGGVGHDPGDEQIPQPVDLVAQGHEPQEGRGRDHQGHLAADDAHPGHHRSQERCQPQDQEDVGDVAADDVAEGDVGLPGECGRDPDGELRRARPEGDDRQPDDERADPEGRGEPARPTDKDLGAADEGCQPHDEQEEGDRVHARIVPGPRAASAAWPVIRRRHRLSRDPGDNGV